jgi:hypothetical protein
MKAIDIKKDLHLLIDTIDNENLLKKFHNLLLQSFSSKKQSLWNKLSSSEQEELLLSFEESFVESNLISNDEVGNWDSKLSQQELDSIARGLQDFKEGKVISHEEVMKKYEKYL